MDPSDFRRLDGRLDPRLPDFGRTGGIASDASHRRAARVPSTIFEPRVTGRAAGESVFVTGDGIEIRNSAASTATYGVTVPSTVRRITVILGGSEIASYTASVIAGRDSVVIQLAR